MIRAKPRAHSPPKLRLDLRSERRQKFTYHPENQLPNFQSSKIAKKILLQRYSYEKALQFICESYPRSLVDLSYQSSDEDMDVDSITSTKDELDTASDE